jgi:predicted RND superfamily exporter protein
MDTQHEEEAGPIPRLLAFVAQVGHRFPWLVLAATALSCVVCLWYTCTHLTYEHQRNDLHNKEKAYYQRWQQYVKEFGDDDDMVVVIQGKERSQMVAALEDIAGQIQESPQLYDR